MTAAIMAGFKRDKPDSHALRARRSQDIRLWANDPGGPRIEPRPETVGPSSTRKSPIEMNAIALRHALAPPWVGGALTPVRARTAAAASLCAICLAAAALGFLLVFLVPPNLPYDEPSHVNIVHYYAEHLQMPILGQPGVSYEGQNGPVYYSLAGLALRLTGTAVSSVSLHVVRSLGIPLLLAETLLTYMLARAVAPRSRLLAIAATALVGLNPTLLAIASSVENDMLALVLAAAAMYLCLRWLDQETIDAPRGAAVGGLVGVAILTKVTTVFLVAGIPIAFAVLQRRRSVPFLAGYLGVILALTGWWFARSTLLYGDPTARAPLEVYGFGILNLSSRPATRHWLENLVAYYWSPTEYYRNAFRTPLVLKFAVGAVYIGAAMGFLRWWREGSRLRRMPPTYLFVAVQFAACLLVYVYECLRIANLPPRAMFPTFPVFAIAVAGGGLWVADLAGVRGRAAYVAGVVSLLTALNLHVLTSVASVHDFAYIRFD
jgi:4-amino-4-deoxy-L-arabinose transferase-like glycosyltransferase